jgi:hypothetical protein
VPNRAKSDKSVIHAFFYEGGTFTASAGWSAVCSLALPHREVDPARREIDFISRQWLKFPTGGRELTAQRNGRDQHKLLTLIVLDNRPALAVEPRQPRLLEDGIVLGACVDDDAGK